MLERRKVRSLVFWRYAGGGDGKGGKGECESGYSVRSVLAGLAVAALIACRLIVATAMTSARIAVKANTVQVIVVL